jgi:hypothetical protein
MSHRTRLAFLRLGAIVLITALVPLLCRLMLWLPWEADCMLAGAAALAFAYRFEQNVAA